MNLPSLDTAPVWATVKDIPFDLITKGLSLICKPFGRVVDSKPFKSITSAEVKVVVDLTKPLPSEVELECDNGRILVISVSFTWLPPLCSHCNELGHQVGLCPSAPAVGKKEQKKGKAKSKSEWKPSTKNPPPASTQDGTTSSTPEGSNIPSSTVTVDIDPAEDGSVIAPEIPVTEPNPEGTATAPSVFMDTPGSSTSTGISSQDNLHTPVGLRVISLFLSPLLRRNLLYKLILPSNLVSLLITRSRWPNLHSKLWF